MSDLCIACSKVVGTHQHALSCDACDCWQHCKFARQVIQFSFISYFEANIYLFIYSNAKAHIHV